MIKPVIEENYHMVKLTVVGSSKGYRVEIYSGIKSFYAKPIRTQIRKYNPVFFSFYQSHSQKTENGADAVEENIDSRGNLLKGAFFKFALPASFVFAVWGVYIVWGFLHPKPKSAAPSPTAAVSAEPGIPASSPPALPAPSPALADDSVLRLLRDAEASLYYSRLDADHQTVKGFKAVIRFKTGREIRYFSDDLLYSMGWRLFLSQNLRQVILTDGRSFHVVSQGISERPDNSGALVP